LVGGFKNPSTKKIIKTACGEEHIIGVYDDGTLLVGGFNNYGQLGLGHFDTVKELTVLKLDSIKATNVACGKGHTIVLCEDESVQSFGLNDREQICTKDSTRYIFAPYVTGDRLNKPFQLNLKKRAIKIACGHNH